MAVEIPSLPDTFEASVEVESPFGGTLPGTQYFDYPNLRNRVDVTFFGQTSITLDLYEPLVQYQIAGGDCQKNVLEGPMGPMSLPPFAEYQGNETVDGVNCQKWYMDWFGTMQITWLIDANDEKNAVIKKYTTDMPIIGSITITYKKYINIDPQPDKLFDPSVYGCPPPVPPVVYSVGGYITDAVTGRPVSGASVTLGTLKTTSGAQGDYKFENLPNGTMTLTASGSGYINANKTVHVTRDIPKGTAADLALSPTLQPGQWRVVLTWAQYPQDLDSHTYSPAGCETYYNRRSCSSSAGSAVLDRDATRGYGPETITINYSEGTFKHFVYIYSAGQFMQSNAVVKLYSSDGLVAELAVPTSGYDASSRYWSTFNIESELGFTTVNQVTTTKPSP